MSSYGYMGRTELTFCTLKENGGLGVKSKLKTPALPYPIMYKQLKTHNLFTSELSVSLQDYFKLG